MVDYALTAHAYFDASHTVLGDQMCGAAHGHTFHVSATVVGGMEREGTGLWRVHQTETLQQDLDRIARELDNRDLNAMMVGSAPVPETIAAWFLERLAYADYVDVEMGWRKVTGRATRNKKL
jgi:6-pyruvoyl-tetrahydropterin synthase